MIGVLITAYFMINKPSNDLYAERVNAAPSFKMEASFNDNALSQLLEMEQVLTRAKNSKRFPADSKKSKVKP